MVSQTGLRSAFREREQPSDWKLNPNTNSTFWLRNQRLAIFNPINQTTAMTMAIGFSKLLQHIGKTSSFRLVQDLTLI